MRNLPGRLTLAAAVVVALCSASRAAETAPLVTRIDIRGLASKSPDDMRRDLATRVGKPYDIASLDTDLKRLWRTGKFDTVRWEGPVADGDGVALTLVVEERPRLAAVEFRGRKKLDRDTLKTAVEKAGLLTGRDAVYDEAVAHRAAEILRERYREDYYFTAKIRYFTESYEGEGIAGLGSVKVVFQIEEGRPAPIRGVRFVGNLVFSDGKLKKFVETVVSDDGGFKSYDRLRFTRAVNNIQHLYREQGYLDAVVRLSEVELFTWHPPGAKAEKWLSPVIEIDEGELYRVGEVTLTVKKPEKGPPLEISEEEIMALITAPRNEFEGQKAFKKGEAYSQQVEQRAAVRVEKTIGYHGRIKTTIKRKHVFSQKGTAVDVHFTVAPSRPYRLGGVSVRGNHKTKRNVFLRELEQAGLRPGEIIDSRKLDLAITNIRYTGLVKPDRDEGTGELKRADVRVRPFARKDDTADLYIDVNENETGSLMVGASVNSNGELAGSIEFSQRNFNILGLPRSGSDWTNAFTGAGQTLSISATFGTLTDVFKLDFTEPYFLGLPLRLRMELFDVTRRQEQYTEARNGVGVTLGHSFMLHRYKRRRLSVAAKLRDELVGLTGVESGALQEVQDAPGKARIRRGGLVATYESRDSRLLPTQGSLGRLTVDYAGGPLGGDYEFRKSRFEYQHHTRVKKDKSDQSSVLQFKFTADHALAYGDTAEVPFYERFYAGGFGTIRGFDYRSVGPIDAATGVPVGGTVRILSTIEYTYPLSPDSSLRGSIFYDAGGVWADDDEIYDRDVKQTAGIGLLIQPAGFPVPISLYLGWILNPQPGDDAQIVSFMIGTMFF